MFDIVDLDNRLYQIDPTLPDPTSESQVLEVIDPETLLIAKGSGYGSPRERLVYTRQDDGSIVSVRGGSGSTSYPIDGITRAVDGRDRVSVGSPLVPVAP